MLLCNIGIRFPMRKTPTTTSEMPQSEETQYPLFLHPEVTVVCSQKANGYTYATSIPYCTDSSVLTHSYCTEPPTEEKLSSVMQGISVCVCVS